MMRETCVNTCANQNPTETNEKRIKKKNNADLMFKCWLDFSFWCSCFASEWTERNGLLPRATQTINAPFLCLLDQMRWPSLWQHTHHRANDKQLENKISRYGTNGRETEFGNSDRNSRRYDDQWGHATQNTQQMQIRRALVAQRREKIWVLVSCCVCQDYYYG